VNEFQTKLLEDEDFEAWLSDMEFDVKEQPNSTENTLLWVWDHYGDVLIDSINRMQYAHWITGQS
jgi:hypothetical protein